MMFKARLRECFAKGALAWVVLLLLAPSKGVASLAYRAEGVTILEFDSGQQTLRIDALKTTFHKEKGQIALIQLKGVFGTSEGEPQTLSAQEGVYEFEHRKLFLKGRVKLESVQGVIALSESATVDADPIRVRLIDNVRLTYRTAPHLPPSLTMRGDTGTYDPKIGLALEHQVTADIKMELQKSHIISNHVVLNQRENRAVFTGQVRMRMAQMNSQSGRMTIQMVEKSKKEFKLAQILLNNEPSIELDRKGKGKFRLSGASMVLSADDSGGISRVNAGRGIKISFEKGLRGQGEAFQYDVDTQKIHISGKGSSVEWNAYHIQGVYVIYDMQAERMRVKDAVITWGQAPERRTLQSQVVSMQFYKNRGLKQLTADGAIHMKLPQAEVFSERLTYDGPPRDKMVFWGMPARAELEGKTILGKEFTYFLSTQELRVTQADVVYMGVL